MSSRPTGDFPKIESWQIGNFKHDKLTDVVSCGHLCVMFIESLIVDESKTFSFNDEAILNYRKNYLELLKGHE